MFGGYSPMKALWASRTYCHKDCDYCYFTVNSREGFTPLKEKVIDSTIKSLSRVGVGELYIAGGEPLQQLTEVTNIVRKASSNSIDSIICTNATLLTDEKLDQLLDCGTKGFIVSWDSFNESYNLKFRKYHTDGLNGLQLLASNERRSEYKLGICCVLTKENIDDLLPTIDQAASLGIDWFKFQPMAVPEDHPQSSVMLGSKEYQDLLDIIPELSLRTDIGFPDEDVQKKILTRLRDGDTKEPNCFAGKDFIFINENFQVYPCAGSGILSSFPPSDIQQIEKEKLEIGECDEFNADCSCLFGIAYSGFLE